MKNLFQMKYIALIIVCVCAISCSQTMKEKIGVADVAPNELEVESRKPLIIPPHYDLPEPLTRQEIERRKVQEQKIEDQELETRKNLHSDDDI